MSEEKQTIKLEEVGSLEEVLGLDDPLFQPEPEDSPTIIPQDNVEVTSK